MKKKLALSIGISLLGFLSQLNNTARSANADPVKSMEKVVSKLEAHLKTNPYLVTKTPASQSAFKVDTFSLTKYLLKGDVSYDVKQTNSLVAPYDGVISFNAALYSNKLCGDLIDPEFSNIITYSSPGKAVAEKSNSKCYEYDDVKKITYHMAFKKGKWVLTSMSHKKGYFLNLPQIYSVPSTNVPERTPAITSKENKEAFEINKKWIDAIN